MLLAAAAGSCGFQVVNSLLLRKTPEIMVYLQVSADRWMPASSPRELQLRGPLLSVFHRVSVQMLCSWPVPTEPDRELRSDLIQQIVPSTQQVVYCRSSGVLHSTRTLELSSIL